MLLSLANGRVLEVLEVRVKIHPWSFLPMPVMCSGRLLSSTIEYLWFSVCGKSAWRRTNSLLNRRGTISARACVCDQDRSAGSERFSVLFVDRCERYRWWKRSIDPFGHRSSPSLQKVSTGVTSDRSKHLVVFRYIGNQSIGCKLRKDEHQNDLVYSITEDYSCVYFIVSVKMIVQLFFNLCS